MGIINIKVGEVGQVGEFPRRNRLVTTDSLAIITGAGYLNSASSPGGPIYAIDQWDVIYDYSRTSKTGTYAAFSTAISSAGIITLSVTPNSGNVLLPVVANHIAAFNGTSGQIYNPVTTVINSGSIQAGLSGTAGTLVSFPGTAANGSLILAAVNAGGAFNTTISNTTMGQSTVYTLADIGAATGGIPVSTVPLRIKSVAAAAAAGGAAAQSFTDAFCTSGSSITGNWNTQANAASVLKIAPGNGSFIVTSSADAGVGTFNYTITK